MKKTLNKIIFISVLFLGLGALAKFLLTNEDFAIFTNNIIPNASSEKVKKYILPYREIDILRKQELKLLKAQELIKSLEPFSIENDLNIKKSLKKLTFVKDPEKISIIENKLSMHKYKPKGIYLMRGISNLIPGSAYLDHNEEYLFLLSSTGVLGYSKYNDQSFKFIQIKNNIEKFFGENQIKKSNHFSIKDLLISQGKIFISFTNEVSNDCWNTSLIYADLNFQEINFKPLFMPSECVSSNTKINKERVFHAHQSAGRIISFDEDQILFSTGEYRSRYLAQDLNSTFGKILMINIKNKDFKTVAMGVRNAQGLHYDKSNEIIIFTEHGPKGGDEVNLLSPRSIQDGKVENYGWAISSYGEHYGKRGQSSEKGWTYEGNNPYDKYPLYKSHKKYGFVEPLKYYTPSIGISEIIPVDPKNKIYAHASMVDESLYLFKLDDKNKISKIQRFYLKERIRDMVNFDDKIFIYLEDTGSIGVINLRELNQPIDELF
mgnify:CR=1 FL=1